VIRETLLPHRQFCFQSKRKSTLYELYGTFQRHIAGRRDQKMQMIGHNHELVEEIPTLRAIIEEGLQQELCVRFESEQWVALRSHDRDEECAIRSHVYRLRAPISKACSYVTYTHIKIPVLNKPPGLKALTCLPLHGQEGPLFHELLRASATIGQNLRRLRPFQLTISLRAPTTPSTSSTVL
jgi:hypothetical protein